MALGIALHDAAIEFDSRPGKRTVLAYLGAEHVLGAFVHVALEEVFKLDIRVFFPSVDGDVSVPDVCSEDESVGSVLVEPVEVAFRFCDGDASCRYPADLRYEEC